ncbi:Fanconi anaemia protein FANCD2 [Cunninghamella echinulata]|nr:Fanconi anaemia protein FANCD2 [Cunninghamella echinulata]
MTNSFVELSTAIGCQFNEDSNSITFIVEPSLFRRQLTLKLRNDPNYPNNLLQFIDDFQKYTENSTSLRQCLLSARLSDELTLTNKSTSVDSLFKTLLAIDILQPTMITNLLERLPEFYDELELDNSSSCTARLILHQLRWLDYIVEPQQLTGTLIEIIQVTPTEIQHEIITSLPDILNDTEHKPMVVFLKEWMQENPDLTVPILDAFSNLNLHPEQLDDVRGMVLDRLQSADLDDLAIMIKFLLQTVTPQTIDTTILDIRNNLDLKSLGKIQQSDPQLHTQQTQQQQKAPQSPTALILESIKLGLQFHKFVCDAWVRSLTALESQKSHKIIDVLVLFILYSMASMKKKAEQVLRRKIIAGQITSQLIKETLIYHDKSLSMYIPSIISLTESLLRSSNQHTVLALCAKTIYINIYKASDVYNRQEIIGSLVTHIGSGLNEEMDTALEVLLNLAQENTALVSVYNVFIKGILDYIDNLSLSQIRILFDIFSVLALKDNNRYSGESSLWSDIQIVLRKQLSNPRLKYKKIGILGCLAAVKILGSRELCKQFSKSGESSSQRHQNADTIDRHPILKEAVNLVEMITRSCSEYPICMSMFYDELANLMENGDIDDRFKNWVQDSFTTDFIDTYIVEHETCSQLESNFGNLQSIGIKPTMVLDINESSAEVALKIYPLLQNSKEKKQRENAIVLCSIFNLLQSCEKAFNNGSLEGVDALLGCGIILFDLNDIENTLDNWQTYEADDACSMIYVTINWLREMLNCFSITIEDEDIRRKLITRLKHIVKLESILNTILPHTSNFVPIDIQSLLSPFQDFRENRSLHIKSQSSLRIRSNSLTPGEDNSDNDSIIQPSSKRDSTKTSASKFETVDSLRPFMRGLKIQSLAILGAITTNESEGLKLEYQDINYLLQDINRKLDDKIVPPPVNFFGKKKVSPSNNKYDNINPDAFTYMPSQELMHSMIIYLPKILQVLETAYEDLLDTNTQAGRIEKGSEGLALCISLVIDILYKLFGWSELSSPENQNILMGLIGTLSEQMSAERSNIRTVSEQFKEAFRYLSNFETNIPQMKSVIILFKTLERIMELSCNNEMFKDDAMKVVQDILSRDWFDWREAKKDIPYLVEKGIELSDDPLQTLINYVNLVLPTFDKEGKLEEYPLLKSETVVAFYQAIINQTVKCISLLEERDDDDEALLVRTYQIVQLFERITNYVKVKEQRALFGILLKTSKSFIEQFTKHSIPFFSRIFKDHKDYIANIFRLFQISTRLLQIMCSHVKINKDVQLATYVPPLKKVLEVVIYQVKILLTENNAPTEVFFLGALKHRDLTGATVSSQIPKEFSSDSEDELSDDTTTVQQSATKNTLKPSQLSPSKNAKKQKNTAYLPPKKKVKTADLDVEYRTSSQIPSSMDEDSEIENSHTIELNSEEEEEEEEGDDDDDEEEDEDGDVKIDLKNDKKRSKRPMKFSSFNKFLDEQSQPNNKNTMSNIFSSSEDDDSIEINSSKSQSTISSHDSYDSNNDQHHSSSKKLKPFDLTSKSPKSKKRSYGLGMTRKRPKQ